MREKKIYINVKAFVEKLLLLLSTSIFVDDDDNIGNVLSVGKKFG